MLALALATLAAASSPLDGDRYGDSYATVRAVQRDDLHRLVAILRQGVHVVLDSGAVRSAIP